MASDTRRLRVIVTGEDAGAGTTLEGVGKSAEKSEGKVASFAKAMGGFVGKGVLGLGAIAAAAGTMGISTATNLEKVKVGFTTMLGSAQKADKFLHQLQQFANTTPFEFDDVTGAAQKFLSMGFAAKDVIPMLTSVGDAVAAMGGGAENIDSITTALSQMQVKGKVAGEEIMQLSEQGVPALQILADHFGVSTSQMSKMITNGKVLASEAIPAIVKGLEDGTKHVKGFGGMMQAQSETMAGKWSTFMDTMKTGLGNLATKFLPLAKKGIDLLSKGFGDFFNGLSGKGLEGTGSFLNQLGAGFVALTKTTQGFTVDSKGLVAVFANIGYAIREVITAWQDGVVYGTGFMGVIEKLLLFVKASIPFIIETGKATAETVGWLKQHATVAKVLIGIIAALVLVTKAHAAAIALANAGGLVNWIKNISLVSSVTKVATAVQWAYNGAISAAGWVQAAAGLTGYFIAQKATVVWTKLVTAAQWLWNIALDANPIGLIVIAIAAFVGAIILLWKNSDGFRNFVLNVLWPAIQKAWDGIKTGFMAAINGIVAAWNWLRDTSIAVWNAIFNFVKPIVMGIISFFSPLINAFIKIETVVWGFYNAVWKIVWIAIQIAVKIFVAWFEAFVVKPFLFWFNLIGAGLRLLYTAAWLPIWNGIKVAADAAMSFFANTVVPKFNKALGWVHTALSAIGAFFSFIWNAVSAKTSAEFNRVANFVSSGLNRAKKFITDLGNGIRNTWNSITDAVSKKTNEIMDKVVGKFNSAQASIKKAWDKVVGVTKAPINFMINDVYNARIMPLWNKIAEKFGIKTRLDTIKGFAKGGTVGMGYGSKDEVPAMLTRGEGILTTREMKQLGGPAGFMQFRKAIAQYNGGGVAGMGDGVGGWFKSLASKGKDIFQGIAGTVIKPLVSGLRSFINNHLQGDGMSGLLRGGGNTILDKLVSWVSGKDKEIGSIGGAGGGAIGWQGMLNLIHGRFPGMKMISGFRPGATTLSGNRSYHALGRAVDMPPVRALAQWIRSNFGPKTKELITPWNELDLWNGRPHIYSRAIQAQHGVFGNNAHVHWAMDGVTTVQPGAFMGVNRTGKPETLVNSDLIPGGVTINGGLHLHGVQDVKGLRDELIKLSRRNGGNSGLPK